jgi:hypothetical protein
MLGQWGFSHHRYKAANTLVATRRQVYQGGPEKGTGLAGVREWFTQRSISATLARRRQTQRHRMEERGMA